LPGAGRGESAFPQLRFVALVENGTHVLHREGLIEDEVLHDLERDLDLEELGALYQRGDATVETDHPLASPQ
jgi:hypothetical protein